MYVIAQSQNAAAITLASGAATAAFNVVAGEPGAGTQLNLNVPGSNRLNGQGFRVRASGLLNLPAGTVTTAATPIQYQIFGSNTVSFAAASGNALFSGTAVAIFTYASTVATSCPFQIELECIGGGNKLVGRGNFLEGDANNVILGGAAPVAIAQSPSSINWQTEPPMQFAVGVLTAAANNFPTGTTLTLNELVLEA
jgi:hypothetical protein